MPALGQTVAYCLNRLDVEVINERRRRAERAAAEPPHPVGPSGAPVAEGDVYAAVVVRMASLDPDDGLNLQVLLDGDDTLWVQRVIEGTGPGSWSWPEL